MTTNSATKSSATKNGHRGSTDGDPCEFASSSGVTVGEDDGGDGGGGEGGGIGGGGDGGGGEGGGGSEGGGLGGGEGGGGEGGGGEVGGASWWMVTSVSVHAEGRWNTL